MKTTIYLTIILALTSCINQKEPLILNATSKTVSIKDGNEFHQDIWSISSEVELDEFVTRKFSGEKKVSFISDIDTLVFDVTPNNIYDFIIQLNDEKAFTRINTDTLKAASITEKIVLEYYYKDKDRATVLDTIPFKIGNDNGIHITGKINNSNSLDFLFDTGANGIVITSSIIGKKLNIEIDGKTENNGSDGISTIQTSSNNKLEIGDLNWNNIELLSIDYQEHGFDGVLGWIAFENKIIEIDYENKLLIIHKSLKTVPKGYSKIETKMIGNIPYIKGTITIGSEKSSGWFEYDTGYNGSFSLSQKFASENGLNGVMKKVGTSTSSGSAGIEWKSNNYVLPKLQLGEFEISNVPLLIDEKDPEGIEDNDILGNSLLKRFNTIIDLQNFEIYLKPNSLMDSEY